MSSPISNFYRVFFTTIDPLIAFGGACTILLSPKSFLGGYAPNIVYPPATETKLLMDCQIGWFASLAFLQAVLLRAKPNDVTVWKLVQTSTIIVDVITTFPSLTSTRSQGHSNPLLLRGSEISHILANGALALLVSSITRNPLIELPWPQSE